MADFQEKRLTRQLVQLWESLRPDRKLPAIETFEAAAEPAQLAHCLRVVCQPDDGYRIEFMGERMVEAFADDRVGQQLRGDSIAFPETVIHHDMAEVIARQLPTEGHGYFGYRGGGVTLYRTCYLPFETQPDQPQRVIAALTRKTSGL